jgi:hypothetical protein
MRVGVRVLVSVHERETFLCATPSPVSVVSVLITLRASCAGHKRDPSVAFTAMFPADSDTDAGDTTAQPMPKIDCKEASVSGTPMFLVVYGVCMRVLLWLVFTSLPALLVFNPHDRAQTGSIGGLHRHVSS